MKDKQRKYNRMYNRRKCRICGKYTKLNSFSSVCRKCELWQLYVGNPKITMGNRRIHFKLGKESIIWDRERNVFKSCTCTNETYKGGRCKHKSVCHSYLIALGFVPDEIILSD